SFLLALLWVQAFPQAVQQHSRGVAAVLPVKDAPIALLPHIAALLLQRAGIVKAAEGASVKETGGLGGFIPVAGKAVLIEKATDQLSIAGSVSTPLGTHLQQTVVPVRQIHPLSRVKGSSQQQFLFGYPAAVEQLQGAGAAV